MCVVALAFNAHPRWPLVLAGNRDEFHARPSAALARWDGEDSHIIAGRDLQSGGTWLGVSELGRLAVVTNIRTGQMPDPNKATRGALVADYLRFGKIPDLDTLAGYNPFSLLTVGANGATLSANHAAPLITPMPPGIHGLSNGAPGDQWPRKDRLIEAFSACLNEADHLTETLFAMLVSESIDDSIFIREHVYGTRCSTVVMMDGNGSAEIVERRFGILGIDEGETRVPFQISNRHDDYPII